MLPDANCWCNLVHLVFSKRRYSSDISDAVADVVVVGVVADDDDLDSNETLASASSSSLSSNGTRKRKRKRRRQRENPLPLASVVRSKVHFRG